MQFIEHSEYVFVVELHPAEFLPAAADENKLSRTQSCCSGWKRGGDSL